MCRGIDKFVREGRLGCKCEKKKIMRKACTIFLQTHANSAAKN